MAKWLDNAIFYEIYPQSFLDTNGDGIGDFQGIIEKLDYIKELGCNAIWMNPCFASPFGDAGYDVADYYQAAPRYGTNADLKRLFNEVHKRNMHILLDLVPGHTSVAHPWFKESCKADRNEFTDRYIWTDSTWGQLENMGSLCGISEREGSVIVNFFAHQPALNYGFYKKTQDWQQDPDDPGPKATLAEMENVMRFWIGMGCDGFRVDMAGSLVKNDEDKKETIRLWQDVRAFLNKEFPEAALVSEWGKPEVALEAGFDMDFYLHFGDTGYMDLFRGDHPYFGGDPESDISVFAGIFAKNQENLRGKGMMCMPSGNHDMARISYQLDEEQLRLAYGFIYGFPGAPFLYYGDEIGMRYIPDMISVEGGYERTGSRTPMQWSKGVNGDFSSAPSRMLYMAMDPDTDRPDAESQMAQEDSLYHWIQRLIALRKAYPCFENDGYAEFVKAEKGCSPIVLKREKEGSCGYVVLNPFDQPLFVEDFGIDQTEQLICRGGAPKKTEDHQLEIAAKSMAWLLVK